MPKIIDHDKHREKLLYKCFKFVASRGYANITMREIAKKLNISTGSLYHYFPNKEGMMKNMLELIIIREVEKAYNYSIQGDTIDERVDRLLRYIFKREMFFQNLLLIALDYSKLSSKKDHVKFIGRLAQFIQEKISEGGFGLDRSFGVLMLNLISGILINRRLFKDEVNIEQQIKLGREVIRGYFNT